MTDRSPSSGADAAWLLASAALFVLPVLHPLLIPVVGVPSHLLWWVHVLPVALLTFAGGMRAGVAAFLTSAVLVAGGEWLFGMGYGVPATTETIVALTFALSATNVLVVSFALYARHVSRRYRLLFDRVRIGVISVGTDDRVVGVNPAACDLLGLCDGSELVGSPLTDVLRLPGIASYRDLEDMGVWSGRLELGGPDSGRSLHAVVTTASDPQAGTYQVFVADRSTEAMQEQELERQAKLSSLGEALAGVAHELNNPLTVILAHAQLAAEEAADGEDVTESFQLIEEEARRMRGLVGELVGFSRHEEKAESADVDEVVARLVRVQRITLGKKVSIAARASSGATIPVSASKIEQVLINLVSNAAYSAKDGGSKVVVSASTEDDTVRIAVEDDGPGIAPEIMDRLFEPFATTKPPGEGTGLGLAISRRLARSWHGDLVAANLEPRGARFELHLPLTDATAAEADVDVSPEVSVSA